MAPLQILVVDPFGRVPLPGLVLPSNDHRLIRLASTEAARTVLARDPRAVCCVVLEPTLLRVARDIESMVCEFSETGWVALADAELLGRVEAARLVLHAFDDHRLLPCDPGDLLASVQTACRRSRLRSAHVQKPNSGADALGLQGSSPKLKQLLNMLERITESDAPVLILGETGTGKELIARAIHRRSGRSGGPLIAVNCGAIAPTLIQSELFGHEKHAFTGAMQRRQGSVEAAHGGSLFLDEIGELPLEMQPALLRVLQERSVTRLGATSPVPVDFRLIAATHVELSKAVASGRFREDLFFRVNVLTLQVPALREREDDVLALAEHFVQRFARERRDLSVRGFTQEAITQMRRYRWPGNVRELMNRVQRAVVMTDRKLIGPSDLGFDEPVERASAQSLAQARDAFERELLRERLRLNGRRISSTARQLGISRVTLYRMMARLDLQAETESRSGSRSERDPGISATVSELNTSRF